MATVYIGQALCSWSAPTTGGAVAQYRVKFAAVSGGPYPITSVVALPSLSVPLVTANPSLGPFYSVVAAENAAGHADSNEVFYTAIADVPVASYRYSLIQFAVR